MSDETHAPTPKQTNRDFFLVFSKFLFI